MKYQDKSNARQEFEGFLGALVCLIVFGGLFLLFFGFVGLLFN